jgi:glycosyltransferase involved in cell wall biosynthesis
MENTMDNKPKRHCMVVLAQYPLGETRVQREAEALINCGYEVDVISWRIPGQAATDKHRGVRIFREKAAVPMRLVKKGNVASLFPIYFHFLLSAAIKLTKLHRQRPYDTIQVHNLPDFLVFSALLPKLAGVPIILDLHDLMPEFFAGRFGHNGSSLPARLIRWQERLACRFADHVITVSEHWRQALIERGVPPHKCSVVMNVADESIFHWPETNCPRPPSQDGFRLIYHGTIVHRYGLDLALQAIAAVKDDIPNVHLTILGLGHDVSALIEMAEELNLSNHVTIRKELRPAEELPGIIRAADVGVVPYRNDIFTDGLLPTKLMEYAALGLPAIAARTTAIERYFRDTMVEFFQPGDVGDLARCIRTLFNDRGRLKELAQGSQKFNQRYNWTKISAEYVALIEQLSTR